MPTHVEMALKLHEVLFYGGLNIPENALPSPGWYTPVLVCRQPNLMWRLSLLTCGFKQAGPTHVQFTKVD